MVSLVWRTDVHMSDRTPSSRKDVWSDTVLDKLNQVKNIAVKSGASLILDGGDFFHIKSPMQNSHELIRRVLDHHGDYPIPVCCVPGNHDSVYGDYSFLGQQPLGVLYSSGLFNRLYDEHEVFVGPRKDGTVGVFHVNRSSPGLFAEGEDLELNKQLHPLVPLVRIVGVPYHGSTYDMNRFRSIQRGPEDLLICAAHVLASLNGGSMFEGEDIVRYSDLLDTAPDVFFFGHWHKDQGVEELGGKKFVNIGSLTRGSLSQDEVQRRPACAVLRFSLGSPAEIETVRLEVEPPEKVFDVEGRARQVRTQLDMDTFVDKMKSSLIPLGTETLSDSIKSLNEVSSDIRERALLYLEKAQAT